MMTSDKAGFCTRIDRAENAVHPSSWLCSGIIVLLLMGCQSEAETKVEDIPSGPYALLESTVHTNLVAEIDFIGDNAPAPIALDLFEKATKALTEKPGTTEFRVLDTGIAPTADDPAYTLDDIKALEAEHRSVSTGGDTASLYFLFVDGHYAEDTDTGKVLGLAYGDSSVVIFKETIVTLCSAQVADPAKVEEICGIAEATTWVHELGHLGGLTNNGIPMQTPHQDPDDHGAHCDNPKCIMYWLNNTEAMIPKIREAFMSGERGVYPLDTHCLEDIGAVRQGSSAATEE